MYIYTVPRGAASSAVAVGALGVKRRPCSNDSIVWGAMVSPPRTEIVRRYFRSAVTTTAAAASPSSLPLIIGNTLTTPNSTTRPPKPNRVVLSFPPSRPWSPPQPPPSATVARMILVISSKVWERSGWWLCRSHARRGKRDVQVGIIRCGKIGR